MQIYRASHARDMPLAAETEGPPRTLVMQVPPHAPQGAAAGVQ